MRQSGKFYVAITFLHTILRYVIVEDPRIYTKWKDFTGNEIVKSYAQFLAECPRIFLVSPLDCTKSIIHARIHSSRPTKIIFSVIVEASKYLIYFTYPQLPPRLSICYHSSQKSHHKIEVIDLIGSFFRRVWYLLRHGPCERRSAEVLGNWRKASYPRVIFVQNEN